MDAMTSQDRQEHIRMRLKGDLEAVTKAIEIMQHSLDTARSIWLFVVVGTTAIITIVFSIAFVMHTFTWDDVWICIVIIIMFALVRYISYRIIANQMKTTGLLIKLCSHEANTVTLKFLSNGIDEDEVHRDHGN
jgi:uncharacterized membrane protein YdbT with pleckstrin-like domain